MIRTPEAQGYKGSSGRLVVVGGSADYTGAPFFSAIAALRAGLDLATVLCPLEASTAIKSYSPDLIVRPLLTPDPEWLREKGLEAGLAVADDSTFYRELEHAYSRAHALVIGPGLALQLGPSRRRALLTRGPPTVIDASGLPLLLSTLANMAGSADRTRVIVLTPNVHEVRTLYALLIELRGLSAAEPRTIAAMADELARELKCCVLVKGRHDYITLGEGSLLDLAGGEESHSVTLNHESIFCNGLPLSDRRAAGQGDLLSGLVGAFLAWSFVGRAAASGDRSHTGGPAEAVLAACGASITLKTAASHAYSKNRRYLASDLIPLIGPAVDELASLGQEH